VADKTLLEKVEEANRQPVPDRRLISSVAVEQINAQERSTSESPTHREDFKSLLSAAARRQPQGG
jgi:hypothetical protein